MAENIIYYGPPGTGKTFLMQSLMSDYIDYSIPDSHIRSIYVKNTQNWILIALIMLQNHGKMRIPDIQAKVNSLNLGKKINVGSVLEEHSMNTSVLGVKRSQPCVFFEVEIGQWYVNRIRIQQYMPSFFEDYLGNLDVDQRYAFVTFHQSFSYEDFIEGIRPEYIKATNSVDYSPKPGIFKEICEKAREHSEKEYAVFIDEINRGNISEILGELITLIEVDKREGTANELSVTLPYSKETFVVPNNLNIIGTMNSADRSIGMIDIALRRRFKFIPMNPDPEAIRSELIMADVDPENIDGIDVLKLFNVINGRIELLMDHNHMIGHALFMHVRNGADIVSVIRDRVIPLLEEYFFNDLQKIQLIFNDLDDTGMLKSDAIYIHDTLAVSDYFDFSGDYLLDDKKHYQINPDININSLKHIYR